jgi:hypothetical protein
MPPLFYDDKKYLGVKPPTRAEAIIMFNRAVGDKEQKDKDERDKN